MRIIPNLYWALNFECESLLCSQKTLMCWYYFCIIERMCLFHLIQCLSSFLDRDFVSMDPRNYPWLENGFLLLQKCLCQLPPELLKICKSCKDCSTKIYECVSETSWNLPNILWLQCKTSKYLQKHV